MKTVILISLILLFASCKENNPVEPIDSSWTETTNLYLSISQDATLSYTNLDVFLNYTSQSPIAVKVQVGNHSLTSDSIVLVNPARDVRYYLCRFVLDKSATGDIRVFVKY